MARGTVRGQAWPRDEAVPANPAGSYGMLDEPGTVGAAFAEQRRARVSAWATAGLITGLLALCASLTGLLAPLGFALGVLSVIIGLVGLWAVSRPHVTGHSLVIIGLLAAAAAIVIGVLAMTGEFTWPNSDTNEIDRVHDWLDDNLSWLDRW